MTYPILKTADAKELEGYSLLPISRTDGKKGKSGLCCQVPALTDSVVTVIYNDPIGSAWIRSQIASLQSHLASTANKAGQAVQADTIGVTALLAGMTAAEAAARMSKESIAAWFKEYMAPLVTAALEAKGMPEGVVVKVLEGFEATFCKLAQREASFSDAEYGQLVKALELIPDVSEAAESVMTEKIATKLEATQTKTISIIDAL